MTYLDLEQAQAARQAAHPNTKETTPWLIWFDSVQAVARLNRPIPAELVAETKARMLRAYQAGEPVWLAADELVQRYEGARIAKMEGADGRAVIRCALRGD